MPGNVIAAVFLFLLVLVPATVTAGQGDGIYAHIETDKGLILARLYYQRAPLTVMNFVSLAEGTREWTDPVTGEKRMDPLYQNLKFHQVRDFMIQTGDPSGSGKGDPGYMFADEFHPELSHSTAGILSMANRGPNTNGSQFFITTRPAKWLDNHHTVFGEVVAGMDVLSELSKDDGLKQITIERIGKDAQAFNPASAHKLAELNQEALREGARKRLPKTMPAIDAAKVPGKDQQAVSPGSFKFIIIGHSEMRTPDVYKRPFYYDRLQAVAFSEKLVRLARGRDVSFDGLIDEYSDMSRNSLSQNIHDDPRLPLGLKAIFTLQPGQISDPIDLPTGVYIFERL
jgi:cyclophilin family peptidyl-prolyl cis-trans isomerase